VADAARVAVASVGAVGVAAIVLVAGIAVLVTVWPPHAARIRQSPTMIPYWYLRISFPPFTGAPLRADGAQTVIRGSNASQGEKF
jgi:hypothetical protein